MITKYLFSFVFCFLFLKNTIIAQTESLPADFPKYVDTGNPEKDMADLAVRKQAWAKGHPNTQIPSVPASPKAVSAVDISLHNPEVNIHVQANPAIVFTQGEYDLLSPERKQKMKTNPQEYPITIIPNIQVTKLQFLALPEIEQQTMGKYEIIDLVYTGELPKIKGEYFYIYKQDFLDYTMESQLLLLKNEQVVIIPDAAIKPKILINKGDFETYPEEKQKMLMESGEALIE